MPPRKLSDHSKLANRIRDLERLIDSWPVTNHREVWDYLEQLAALEHFAHNQVRRPDDLGGNISGTHAASRSPSYDAVAHAQFKVELAHLRQRAQMLHTINSERDEMADKPTGRPQTCNSCGNVVRVGKPTRTPAA